MGVSGGVGAVASQYSGLRQRWEDAVGQTSCSSPHLASDLVCASALACKGDPQQHGSDSGRATLPVDTSMVLLENLTDKETAGKRTSVVLSTVKFCIKP